MPHSCFRILQMIRTLAEYEAMLAKGMFSEPPEKPTQRVLTHMSKREDDLGPPKKKSKVEERPYTPAELLLFQCGECESCRKRECIKCVSCINNAQDATEKMCCFQKVC